MAASPGSRGSAGTRARAVTQRLSQAWRALTGPQRMAAGAALGLAATMLLPWYATTSAVRGRAVTASHSALFTLGWVELAILLVAAAVLTMLYMRSQQRPFHLPGGDGTVILAAGLWVGVLLVWRLFDRPAFGQGLAVTLSWGFFVACAAAAFLVVAGVRLRAAHTPEPPLRRARGAGEGDADVWLDEDRPHLAPTRVIGQDPGSRRSP